MFKRLMTFIGLGQDTPAEEPRSMPSGPACLIRDFAAGDDSLRYPAISAYRAHLDSLGARGTPEMRFMSEIDNSVPDLRLRGLYRQQVLDSHAALGSLPPGAKPKTGAADLLAGVPVGL